MNKMYLKDDAIQDSRPWPFKMFLETFIKSFSKIMMHPSEFFKENIEEGRYTSALSFLFTTSILFSLPAGFLATGHPVRYGAIFFLNAFFMPFVLAFFLYLPTLVLYRNLFTYMRLFQITAYAQVTLLIGWFPGLAAIAGIWKFYLIGLGMAKAGPLRGSKAAGCLIIAMALMFMLIYFMKPVLAS